MIKHSYYLIDIRGNKTPVSRNGDIWYILKTFKANRNINTKADRKADELLAIGMSTQKLGDYCLKNRLNLIHEWEEI